MKRRNTTGSRSFDIPCEAAASGASLAPRNPETDGVGCASAGATCGVGARMAAAPKESASEKEDPARSGLEAEGGRGLRLGGPPPGVRPPPPLPPGLSMLTLTSNVTVGGPRAAEVEDENQTVQKAKVKWKCEIVNNFKGANSGDEMVIGN